MSPLTHLSVLALASTALASPYVGHKHGHGHQHLHGTAGTGAPYPYPSANATEGYGSTGVPTTQTSINTATEYSTQTVYHTVNVNYASSASVAAAGYETSAAGDECAAVTVTQTEKVTQYVTEGSAPSSSQAAPVSSAGTAPGYSAPAYSSSSSTEASPVESSSAASAPGYSAPSYSSSSSSSEAAPVSSSYSAPAYSSSSSSTEAAPVTTSEAAPSYSSMVPSTTAAAILSASISIPDKGADQGSKTSSAAASYSSSSSSSGKRGLAYNDASLVSCFSGSNEVSWAYNWGSSSNGLEGNYKFIPTLWGTSDEFTGSWSDNAKSAISSGATHLFSFNEPDLSTQANLGAAAAASAYSTYMNPFKGQAKLCAPSVTNGGGSMGLTWLQSFLDSCTDCQIDCLSIHWYDSAENTEYFKSHVQQAIDMANGKPIYVSEFGATGSDDQIKSFLEEVMPWMDSNDNIAGYAYYMVSDGLLVTGSEPSTYGSTYMSYTS